MNLLTSSPSHLIRDQGVTLVELVVVILILGILAGGTTAYVVSTAEGYSATAARSDLSAVARLTLKRLEKEVSQAVPNSLRVSEAVSGNQCLEFFPIEDASRYLDVNFSVASATMTAHTFSRGAVLTSENKDLHAIIFPIQAGSLYEPVSPGPLATISTYAQSETNGIETLSLDNPHLYEPGTDQRRIYLAGDPVSFCVEGSKIFRFRNYGIQSSQCLPSTPSCLPSQSPDRSVISDHLNNADYIAFEILEGSLSRNSLVSVQLNFEKGDETLLIEHDIRVRNAP